MIEIAPESEVNLSIDMAWLYCVTLTHNEKYNWRMPTYMEKSCSIPRPPFLSWDSSDFASGPVYNMLSHKVIPVRDSDK